MEISTGRCGLFSPSGATHSIKCQVNAEVSACTCSVVWGTCTSKRGTDTPNWQQMNLEGFYPGFLACFNKSSFDVPVSTCAPGESTGWYHCLFPEGSCRSHKNGLSGHFLNCFLLPQSQSSLILPPFQICQKPLGSAWSSGSNVTFILFSLLWWEDYKVSKQLFCTLWWTWDWKLFIILCPA